jgi:hypothetical protein
VSQQRAKADIQATLIPPLTKIHTYQLDISSYTSQGQFDLHHTLFSLPSLKQKAINDPLAHFPACPSLSTIHLPSPIDFFSRHTDIFSLPSESSVSFKGFYAAVYEHDGRELIHCRRRIPRDDLPDIFSIEDWEESARYEGVEVPVQVLAAMYGSAGVRLRDVRAGRGQRLPDEAWCVLQQWMHERECW